MNFSTQDTLTVAALLREAALAEIMPRFRSLTEGQVRQKSSATDLVTDADEAAERLITARLKETFPAAKRRKSNAGKGFPAIHQQIMNFKGWLRGIHHQCSEKHYQNYLDEYCFRTNRRNTEKFIFRNIMQRIVSIKTKTFKELKAYAA